MTMMVAKGASVHRVSLERLAAIFVVLREGQEQALIYMLVQELSSTKPLSFVDRKKPSAFVLRADTVLD